MHDDDSVYDDGRECCADCRDVLPSPGAHAAILSGGRIEKYCPACYLLGLAFAVANGWFDEPSTEAA